MANDTPVGLEPGASELQTDVGPDFPSAQSVLILGISPGYTLISLPQSGTLWVVAEGDPPNTIYLWHQGGSTEKIPMNTPVSYKVGAHDALIYQFTQANPNFKLVWAYA